MGLVQGRSQYNWEHGIPCMNPHCKSYGKPHPNCMCGSGGLPHAGEIGSKGPSGPSASITKNYAEGGDVRFCDRGIPHQDGCEYYEGNQDLGKLVIRNAIQRHESEDDLTDSLLGKSSSEHAIHGLIVNSGASNILGDSNESLFESPKVRNKLSDLSNEKLSKKALRTLVKIGLSDPSSSMSPDFLKEYIRPAVKKLIGSSNTNIIDAVIYALSQGKIENIDSVMKYASKISSGHKEIDSAIESLFGGEELDHSSDEKDRDNLKNFINKGGINAQLMNISDGQDQSVQNMAQGGLMNRSKVEKEEEKLIPEHSTILGMIKGNVNNYLQGQRPEQNQGLPFDGTVKNAQKDREYNVALDIANKPLSVFGRIRKGSLLPEHMRHFIGMYPDLYNYLSKKTTERVMSAQLNNERPSYRVRQGLHLFLGSPLDSTMSPQAIQSIQSIYAPRQSPQIQTQSRPQKNTTKMGKIAEDHYTGGQAAEKRQTAWD